MATWFCHNTKGNQATVKVFDQNTKVNAKGKLMFLAKHKGNIKEKLRV